MVRVYRIAIVDDEIGAIRHLSRLLKTDKQCEIVMTYTNPTEALEYLPHEKIDIAFLDIMMPVMDGLTLAERILKQNSEITVILLTSYRDFSFAQKAVSVGVFAYWVKHELHADTIKEKMNEVKKSVICSQQMNQYKTKVEIRNFLETGNSPPECLVTRQENYFFSLLYIKQRDGFIPTEVESLTDCMRSSVTYPFFWSEFIAVSDVVFCIIGYKHSSIKHIEDVLEKSLKLSNCNILISSSFMLKTYTPDLHVKYLNTFSNVFFGEKTCLHLEERKLEAIRQSYSFFQDIKEKYFNRISEAFSMLEEKEITDILKNAFKDERIISGNLLVIHYVVDQLYSIFSAFDSAESKMRICTEYGNMSLEKIEQFFVYWLEEINLEMGDLNVLPGAKARHIMAYIQSNYSKELYIKTLAQKFHMNGDYLRKLFKLETGMNISEYITKIRINKAKKLLSTDQYKIYQIAEMVGYRSASYFSQAFFHVTGTYPTEKQIKRYEVDL